MKKLFTNVVLHLTVLLFTANASNAQLNQWTWVKGNNTANIYGVYGTKGTASAANKPGSRESAGTWTDGAGNLWLFGGEGYAASSPGYLNDLWKYNIITNEWTWVKGDNTVGAVGIYGTQGTAAAANKPGSRIGAVTWTDGNGNLWLFGGLGNTTSGGGFLNDLWKYSITTNEWTWIKGDNNPNMAGVFGTQGTAAPLNKPGARKNSISWTDGSGNFWLFGGYGFATGSLSFSNDLWKYNIATNAWTWVKGDNTPNTAGVYGTQGISSAANKPGARDQSVSWTDRNGNLWLLGGNGYAGSGSGFLNDFWKYNPINNQWTWVKGDNTPDVPGIYGVQGTAAATNKPGARHSCISWTDGAGNLWLFGGFGYGASGAGQLNDLWKYTLTTNEWQWVKGDNTSDVASVYGTQGTSAAANKPGARYHSVSWTDGSGNLWLFGGTFNDQVNEEILQFNDLWKYTLQSPCTPTNLDTTATVCNKFTLNGKTYTASGDYNDTTTNAAGCDSIITLHLTLTSLGSNTSKTDAGCFGSATGSLTVTPTGGVSPYTYRIGTIGAYVNSGTFNNLKAGNYRVSIIDAIGCSGTSNVVIIGQGSPIAATSTPTPATCNNTYTGAITITPANTLQTYTYSMGTSGIYQSSNVFNNLRAGTYRVTIKDAGNCKTALPNIVVTQPTKTFIVINSVNNPNNSTLDNGTISVSGSGGAGGYQFRLGTVAPYQSSGTFSNLKAGKYRVYIKDANDCAGGSVPLTLTNPIAARGTISKPASESNSWDVVISPNPTTSAFKVLVNGKPNQEVQIRVLDLQGRAAYQTKGFTAQSYTFGQSFAPGMYMVEVRQGNEVKTLKAVKIR